MTTHANIILTGRRKETTFVGGDDANGLYMPKQTVAVARCVNEDEDLWYVRDVNGKDHKVDGCDLSPHPESPLTNVEFVTTMMEFGHGGALLQAFILNAIEQQARATLTATAEELDTPFISGKVWRDCALEALGWFAAREARDKR